MYHRRHSEIVNLYWPIRQPVLANWPTGIDQITNRYWPNHQPVLANSPNGIDKIANWYFIPRKRVGNLANTGWWFGQYGLANWPIPVGDFRLSAIRICIIYMYVFVNIGWRFGQYRLAIWPIPVGKLANTGWRFGQYWLAIWPIPVGDLANTGEGTFSKIWAGLRSKSRILKTWRVLELCLDGIKNKKKSIWLQKWLFNMMVALEIVYEREWVYVCVREEGENDRERREPFALPY